MKPDLDQIIDQITSSKLFLRLKKVNENHEGWHDNESTFDHLVKTANIARKERDGGFIKNHAALKLFQNWMNENISEIPRKYIVVITALVHDCGKLLSYKEADKTHPLVFIRSSAPDQTMFPSHEFWGGEIVVQEVLKEVGLPDQAKNYIAESVKQHGVFPAYFNDKASWSLDEIITDVKSRAEGLYMESLFNMYCDGYTATGFSIGKKRIEELFNSPNLYVKRTYHIPQS